MGKGLLGLVFLVVAGFSIGMSRRPSKTLLYALAGMALTFGIVMGTAQVFPTLNTEATGAATFNVMLLVGMLTAAISSRKSRG
jgi:H+/Cl- antiporter ClcA